MPKSSEEALKDLVRSLKTIEDEAKRKAMRMKAVQEAVKQAATTLAGRKA